MASMKTSAKQNQRAMLNTTIDKDVLDRFKVYCKERGYQMNTIVELFMRQFVNGEFVLKIDKNKDIEIDVEE